MEFEIEDLKDIVEKFSFEQEKEYTWEELEKSYPLKARKTAEYLSNSDLPNIFFLKQFGKTLDIEILPEEEWLHYKKYWDACAFILIKRGLPKIADIKKEILVWWKDPNWPGFLLVHKFVLEHKEEFEAATKEAILFACKKKDWTWLGWLLELLYKDVVPDLTEETVQKIDETIDFLDTCKTWENFVTKYGDFIKQLSL